MSKVSVGDLVQCVTEPEVGVGIVVETGMVVAWGTPHEPPCIKVQWAPPIVL